MDMNYSYLTTSYDSIVDHVYIFLVEKYHLQHLLKPFMVVDPARSPEEICTADSYTIFIHYNCNSCLKPQFCLKLTQRFIMMQVVSNQEVTRK